MSSPAPTAPVARRPARRHRAFLVFTASYAALLLLLVLAWTLLGESLVLDWNAGHGHRWVHAWLDPRRGQPLEAVQRIARGDFWSWVLLATSLWGLVALGYLVAGVWRKPWLLLLVPLVWWVGLELLIAPHLNFPLWLVHYNLIRNVDHRPTATQGDYNSDSLRGTPEPGQFRPENLNLVFLGDSFTAGLFVAAEEAFPSRVRELLRARHPGVGIETANFGWPSSSPVLSHRWLVDIGEKYSPDVVLMCVDMTDFGDDLRYARMLERRGLYWAYDKFPLTLKLFQQLAPVRYREVLAQSVGDIPPRRYFVTDAPLEENRVWMEPLVEHVAAIDRWCDEHGADFVLVVIPRHYQYTELEVARDSEANEYTELGPYVRAPFRFFEELRGKVDYPILPLLADFATSDLHPHCFEDNSHWNAAGHQIAAEAILRGIEPIVARRLAR